MRRAAALPPIFSWLTDQVSYVQQVSDTEWCSSCPQCGGTVHPDGEWPDRLRIFADSTPLIWCRRCSYLRFADQGDTPPDAGMLERWRKEQERREAGRKRSAERALANLRRQRIDDLYHDALAAEGRADWRARGIPDSMQDYWNLGWRTGQQPSLTIPLYAPGRELLNVKHRLLNPAANEGKYRYELAGMGQPLFLATPDDPLGESVVAIEGEIKAMVTAIHAGKGCFVGLPGARVNSEVVSQLSAAERVLLVMDPGAKKEAISLARRIGIAKCWLLVPALKVDDGIRAAHLGQNEVRRLLGSAIRINDYVTKTVRA